MLQGLGRGLDLQGLNLFQYRFQPVFQLFLTSGLDFGPRELRIIRQRTAVKIDCFGEQVDLLSILYRHCSILNHISRARGL